MKHAFIIIITMITLISVTAYAGRIPFGHQVETVQNYNRAAPQVATSGLIGDGGAPLLAAHGFKTVIDMRTPNEGTREEKALVEGAALIYVNIPMTVANISKEHVATFTEAMKKSPKPVLVHCGSGNRAGAIWASYLISQGTDMEEAIEAGRKAGMRPPMEEKVRALFAE
ncbi:protein tyrosine phosphatase family protein [Nitrosomonas sp.]|uniref:protein tyrosine phosphatase family protein n=1 Tax=Nitrosomonas sp. TaxID=42353 RepID=UPI002850E6C2|nr:protein tyrosine phosphatase family protein [Nitrosomonas sp.]MCP5292433.1 protein tyrosine phosphatase family protein [Burkholderiales bacterium]MDR4515674.1 protein tyrosine phosphatase family protein [Nitrosomonas sp.]